MELILGLAIFILGGELVKIDKELGRIEYRFSEMESGLMEEIRDSASRELPEHDPNGGVA